MIRITTLLWVALLIVAGGTVMRVSYQVRHVQEHLVQLEPRYAARAGSDPHPDRGVEQR